MRTLSRTIEVRAPFRLRAVVESSGLYECAPYRWERAHGTLHRVEALGPEAGPPLLRWRVREAPPHPRGWRRLDVALDSPRRLGRVEQETALERVRAALNLAQDLRPFYRLCRHHPDLAWVPRRAFGRMLRGTSALEDMVKVLCATNVQWRQAVQMIRRIGALGHALPGGEGARAWPGAAALLAAGEGVLREVGRLGYRATSVIRLCEAVAGREAERLEPLVAAARDPAIPGESIRRRLRAFHGIGPYAARALCALWGRWDRVAIDSTTYEFVGRVHHRGVRPTAAQIERRYAPHGPWQGLVYWCEFWRDYLDRFPEGSGA